MEKVKEEPEITMPCQCEHLCHFERHTLTPKGKRGHAYGKQFPESSIYIEVAKYGNSTYCEDCRRDCMFLYLTQ